MAKTRQRGLQNREKGGNHMAERVEFGRMPDGTPVERMVLQAGELSCAVLTYGGAIQSLWVPDRTGRPVDVVLGFDRLEDYLAQDKCIGALVGRYANRIGGSYFTLNGVGYPLYANDGANHLHGGKIGFNKRVWTVEALSDCAVTLSLVSPDGDEGYPGTLSVQVTYRLSENGLAVEYEAVSDRDTLCNLTNHSYFNLGGHDSGTVTGQTIQLFAGAYTPSDGSSIPYGTVELVDGTPMDLREAQPIGKHIDDDFDQLRQAKGYDHNWVVDGAPRQLRPAARAFCEETGIALEVDTTLPGIQFYSGNFLNGCPAGKGGAPYDDRWGFCLESQFYPNSPNCPAFPQAVLRAGETWRHTTVFRLGQAER
jgi:aldose 1-epimerase